MAIFLENATCLPLMTHPYCCIKVLRCPKVNKLHTFDLTFLRLFDYLFSTTGQSLISPKECFMTLSLRNPTICQVISYVLVYLLNHIIFIYESSNTHGVLLICSNIHSSYATGMKFNRIPDSSMVAVFLREILKDNQPTNKQKRGRIPGLVVMHKSSISGNTI